MLIKYLNNLAVQNKCLVFIDKSTGRFIFVVMWQFAQYLKTQVKK